MFDERADDVYHRLHRRIKRMVSPEGINELGAPGDVSDVRPLPGASTEVSLRVRDLLRRFSLCKTDAMGEVGSTSIHERRFSWSR